DRIYELLAEADVFLLPSYREAFGVAYLEAMAVGLVAIGVRGQGPQAFIEHAKTGFLVEPIDVANLSDCILYIASHRERAREIARAGAVLVRSKFNRSSHAQRLISIYSEMLS